jgi:hypothetical protein
VNAVKEDWCIEVVLCIGDETPLHDRGYASFMVPLVCQDSILNYLIDKDCEFHAGLSVEFVEPLTHLRDGNGAYTLV